MNQSYEIWIEAEVRAEDGQLPSNMNTDVHVKFQDGIVWMATFLTYDNIATLVSRYRQSGECLYGTYFWASDMILIERIDRPTIERVIADLLESGEFHLAFRAA